MSFERSWPTILIFALFVAVTLGISFYFGRRTRTAQSYYAAGGSIHWFINGIAFAGDYLSAASFLGICGMIAFYGYDGFLYSIGYLAGWVVALFVIAEPLKRMGRYTFADALDSSFQSRGIKLSAAISTLAVSIFYLIPQMVGAGALIKPLLGFDHYVGVLIVGAVVVLIVVTAGMVSTTYVQFFKGSLLVIFSAVLTVLILNRGLPNEPAQRQPAIVEGPSPENWLMFRKWQQPTPLEETGAWHGLPFVRYEYDSGETSTWHKVPAADSATNFVFLEAQTVTVSADGQKFVNGLPQGKEKGQQDLWPVGHVLSGHEPGPLGPLEFLRTIYNSKVALWDSKTIRDDDGSVTTVYFPKPTPGDQVLRPGNHPSLRGLRGEKVTDKLNFLSLMLALFCGTASLPHILIRYYTVKDQAAARKSTVVGIGSIGIFYVLTLFLGLGAMTSGALDVTDSNMAAPLLAKSFGELLFAVISAIAFTTVLGTVSGLIVAACGAVVHDLLISFLRFDLSDYEKVRIGKIAAVGVGIIAIVLGILFARMNVNFLVGWAFSVAASANLPALVMLLFWKRTTKQGITAAILVGMISSLAWILASGDTYRDVYGLPAENAWVPFSQPGLVTIPLGFVVLVVVSLLTRKSSKIV